MSPEEQLKLSSQVCFPLYSVSRLLTKAYKPYLDGMGITYPQYLVLLVLWEKDGITVNQITEKLHLQTNTVSPLLKRMEQLDLIRRRKNEIDERSVIIELSNNGRLLKKEASDIPEQLLQVLLTTNIQLSDIVHLKEILEEWMDVLKNANGKS